MDQEENISTEEILASIRNVLLEKQEADAKEVVFELTKDMIQKPVLKPDFNKITDSVLKQYAALFAYEQRKQKIASTIQQTND